MTKSKKTKKLTELILLPLAFFVLGNLFLYLALGPFINMATDAWSMFSFDAGALDGKGINKDIYTGVVNGGYDTTVPSSKITYPRHGAKYGQIDIEGDGTLFEIPLYYGDTNDILRKGAGQYMGSHFPGEGTTILVSAHNKSFFYCLKYLELGDIITVKTSYGEYKYEVTDLQIKSLNDSSAYDIEADYENLVLYTCYPFDMFGLTPNRYFVTAKYVSGPRILLYE